RSNAGYDPTSTGGAAGIPIHPDLFPAHTAIWTLRISGAVTECPEVRRIASSDRVGNRFSGHASDMLHRGSVGCCGSTWLARCSSNVAGQLLTAEVGRFVDGGAVVRVRGSCGVGD